jgi:hypothetical protein
MRTTVCLFVALALGVCSCSGPGSQGESDPWAKVELDLTQLDEAGSRGPPDGKVDRSPPRRWVRPRCIQTIPITRPECNCPWMAVERCCGRDNQQDQSSREFSRRTRLSALRQGDPGDRRPPRRVDVGRAIPLLLRRLPEGAGRFPPEGFVDGLTRTMVRWLRNRREWP